MIYREFLVMRKAALWFSGIFSAIFVISEVGTHAAPIATISLESLAVDLAWAIAMFASIFGVALGNGSREPARILWTLPIARWRGALQIVVMDVAGICSTFVLCAVAFVVLSIALAATASVHSIVRYDLHPAALVAMLGFLLAIYGLSALLGMVARRVPYLGVVAYPVCLLWQIFAQSRSPLGQLLAKFLPANPASVFVATMTADSGGKVAGVLGSLSWIGGVRGTEMLFAIALITCALAIILWQRAQVLA